MSAYEDFVAFVHNRVHELRREAHQVTGDDRLAERLTVLALARLAARWQSTRELDPAEAEQAAFAALAAETGPLLRGGDVSVDIERSDYEESVHRAFTPLELADAAWAHGREFRHRRWRRITVTVVVLALLLTFYGLASRVETPEKETPHADDPNRTSFLMHAVDLLPSAASLSRAPKWTEAHSSVPWLPESIAFTTSAPKVSEGGIEGIMAAAQSVNGGPVFLLDSTGVPHILDTVQPEAVLSPSLKNALTKHAIAPGNRRLLLAQDTSVIVVEDDGSHRSFPVPITEGPGAEVADAAWLADGAILLTQRGGTSLLDVDTGTWTAQNLIGLDAVTPADFGRPLYTLTPGPLDAAADLYANTWDLPGATTQATFKSSMPITGETSWISGFGGFGSRNGDLAAKECEVRDGGLTMPDGYGPAQDCLLIVDVTSGAMTRALVRDSSHGTGMRSGLLGWLTPDVLLLSSMDAKDGATLVIAWSLSTGQLHLVSSISSTTALAFAPVLG